MRTILIAAAAVLSAALPLSQARAWMQRDPGGGYTHSGDAGGYQHSTTVSQQGVAHSSDAGGAWHGSAANSQGAAHASDVGGSYHGTATGSSGTVHTNAYGTTTTTSSASYYHQPAVVNTYAATCANCGTSGWGGAAAVGVAAGVATGVAVATAASHPVYAAPPAVYAALPAGCAYRPVLHQYDCGATWLAPAYGANGVYYRVVPAP
jgi:hypothetical protein